MRRGIRVLLACVGVLAVLGVVTLSSGGTARVGAEDTRVEAIFADASPLVEGSQVRASGVDVGSVGSITLENGKARVAMILDPAVLPLHRDAKLKVRPVNLLGEQYIELDTGSPSAPLMTQPAVIPEKQVDHVVDLQEIIDSLGDPVATSLAAMVTTLGEGMHGSGGEAAAAIKALAPSLVRTQELGRVLGEQNVVLGNLVDQVQPLAEAIAADDGKTLDQLVGSTQQTLSTVAANRQAVDETLAELPGTIATARATLAQLAGTANAATPTLASIRPVTDDLTEISGELRRLADTAEPALASLQPVLDRANELLDEAAPLVHDLRPAGPDLRGAAAGLKPLGDELLDQHLNGVLDFVRLWAMSTNGEDGLSHYFRGVLIGTPKTVTDLVRGVPEPYTDLAKAPRQEVPTPPPGSNLLLPQGTNDPENATGLTPRQEQSMLGQLIGGR